MFALMWWPKIKANYLQIVNNHPEKNRHMISTEDIYKIFCYEKSSSLHRFTSCTIDVQRL